MKMGTKWALMAVMAGCLALASGCAGKSTGATYASTGGRGQAVIRTNTGVYIIEGGKVTGYAAEGKKLCPECTKAVTEYAKGAKLPETCPECKSSFTFVHGGRAS